MGGWETFILQNLLPYVELLSYAQISKKIFWLLFEEKLKKRYDARIFSFGFFKLALDLSLFME